MCKIVFSGHMVFEMGVGLRRRGEMELILVIRGVFGGDITLEVSNSRVN